MTETQAQTSTYGEVTQAGIALVRVLGDLGKSWLLSRNEQRRDTKIQPVVTKKKPDAAILSASISNAVPQAASRSIDTAKLRLTVPAPARASQDAIAAATAKAEQARAAEADFDARFVAVMEMLQQVLVAQRASDPSLAEAQAARGEAAPVAPPLRAQHAPQTDADPIIEQPVKVAAASSATAETASRDVARTEQPSDGVQQEATSAQAACTATTEKPETPTKPPQSKPELPPAQRRAKWLIECKDPHVQSWRMIKRFVRRMTDFDLLAFTSSVPMFRAFLAMLRAMTPYYEGPKFSLDELAPDGMPLAFAMAEQNA